MKKSMKKSAMLLFILAFVLLQFAPVSRTNSQGSPINITIVPNQPTPDIPTPISLQNAAIFAWQEFIALNWPAVTQNAAPNTRDMPNTSAKFGDPTYSGPLVWHTFRNKVEIYPGTGNPPGYSATAPSFGYDAAPQYIYSNGSIPPASGTPDPNTIWINLDENSEIGDDMMFAGIAPTTPPLGQQILFLAKANRTEYTYVAGNQWWTQTTDSSGNIIVPPITATMKYIAQNKTDPTAGSNTLVSFPYGTIEIKSGWRQLTSNEAASGRFYTTNARYYVMQNGSPAYVDTTLGLVALHIIQKTKSAPYFVYATFSQADNILNTQGVPTEDADGNLYNSMYQGVLPFEPNVISQNATSASPANPSSIQQLSPHTSNADPQSRLYYINTPDTPTPQGKIAVNRRQHNINPTIIAVNKAAHSTFAGYAADNKLGTAPNYSIVWQYYKLVSVQYQPYNKPPGVRYYGASGGPDPSTYYQANEVVETDYNLQVFSGQFQGQLSYPYYNVNTGDLITDYTNSGAPFSNVSNNGTSYNMGGCMGCHGNAQFAGAGFSFIFLFGPVPAPNTVGNFDLSKLKKMLSISKK